MKKLMILVLMIIVSSHTTEKVSHLNKEVITNNEYCSGWKDGYCEGWKDVKGQYAICPIAPICPIPEIGKRSYRDAYNRGIKEGRRAALRNR